MFGAVALGVVLVLLFFILYAMWATTRLKLRAARKLCPACGKILGQMAVNGAIMKYSESYKKAKGDRAKRRKMQYNPRWPIVCMNCRRSLSYDPNAEKFVRG